MVKKEFSEEEVRKKVREDLLKKRIQKEETKKLRQEEKEKKEILDELFTKERKVPKEILEVLADPQLLERIDNEFDKKIVREYEARKVVFLVANMRNIENLNKGSDNLILNAPSGTGKDHISEAVFEILPEEEKEELVRTTPKVLSYTRNKKLDPNATWKKVALRLEDVSNNVVNDDSFKVFASANPNKINIGKTIQKGNIIEIEIEGKPAMILTIAEQELRDEQLRRFPTCWLDESINQTKEILKRQAQFGKDGKSIDYDPKITESLRFLKRIKVKIPFADKLTSIFEKSSENVIVRTAFPRFLDYIKSSASLHQYQRKKDEDGYILATEQDYEVGALCLKKTTSNLSMIPLSKLDKKIYDFFSLSKLKNISLDDFMDFEEIQQLGKGDRWIRFRLDWLVGKGFLERHSSKVEGSYKPVNKYSYRMMGEFIVPTFKDLTSNTTNTTINSNNTYTSNTQEKGVNEVFEVFETELPLNNWSDSDKERMKKAGGNL